MNLIAKFTKKAVTIEAIRFSDDADTISNIHGFLGAETTRVSYENPDAPVIKIETLEGTMTAQVGDWIIKGVKGEFYPCKHDIFQSTYLPHGTTNRTFGEALDAAKTGKRIAREGWNGKGMWVCYGQGNPALEADKFWNPHTRKFAEENGGTAEVLPYLIFKTADNKILMGWLASQTDMLATDWCILD